MGLAKDTLLKNPCDHQENPRLIDHWIGRRVIPSFSQISHEHAQQMGIFAQIADPVLCGGPVLCSFFEWSPVVESVRRRLNEISICRATRLNDGVFFLRNLKVAFVFDENGHCYCMMRGGEGEEFMLLANMTAAEAVTRTYPYSALFSRHRDSNLRKLREFEAFCCQNGLKLDVSLSGQFNRLLECIRGELEDDDVLFDIVESSEAHELLSAAGSQHKVPGKEIVSKAASHCNGRNLAARHFKYSIDLRNREGYISTDLVEKMIIDYPLKTLGQLKSVCKAWFGLLQDKVFIRNFHTESCHREQLILVELEPSWDTGSCIQPTFTQDDIPVVRLKIEGLACAFLGSAGGLICSETVQGCLSFVNPVKLTMHTLPGCESIGNSSFYESAAFGYNHMTEEFMLVTISSSRSYGDRVLRFEQNAWHRLLQTCPVQVDETGLVLGDSVFWVVSRLSTSFPLLELKLSSEEFSHISPPSTGWNATLERTISILQHSLYIIQSGAGFMRFWKWEGDFWTQKYDINIPPGATICRPMYSSSGFLVLESKFNRCLRKFYIFNLETQIVSPAYGEELFPPYFALMCSWESYHEHP